MLRQRGIIIILSIILLLSPTIFAEVWTSNLNEGMVNYYNFEEASGNIVYDSISGNNGTLINGGQRTTGKINQGLNFQQASSQKVTLSGEQDFDAIFSGSNKFSMSMWLSPDIITGSQIISKGLDPNFFAIGFEGGVYEGYITLYIKASGSSYLVVRTADACITKNEWNHILVTYDGLRDVEDISIYVNGVLEATTNIFNILSTDLANGDSVILGAGFQESNARYLDGILDELGIWNRVLNQSEINQLYNSGAGITYSNDSAELPSSTLEERVSLLESWKESISSTISAIQASLTSLIIRVDGLDNRTTLLESQNTSCSCADENAKYIKYLPSADKKTMVCGYAQSQHLANLIDMNINCTVRYYNQSVYNGTLRKYAIVEKSTCTCK